MSPTILSVRNIVASCFVGALAAGALVLYQREVAAAQTAQRPIVVSAVTHISSIGLTWSQTNQASDVVVSGVVESVSPTFWNQDDGTLWGSDLMEPDGHAEVVRSPLGVMPALQMYSISVRVDQIIAGDAKPGDVLTFTVVGNSPMDRGPIATQDSAVAKGAANVIVWGMYADMAWRQNGPKHLLVLTGSRPSRSMVVLQADGTYAGEVLEGQPLTMEAITSQVATDRLTMDGNITR